MPGENLTGQFISSTFQRLLQVSDEHVRDGTGSIVNLLPVTTSYALTASYILGGESDPIFISVSASFATTASNIFVGNQVITGSLDITGSLFVNGIAVLTGSETDPVYTSDKPTLATTGSNTFIGNQTITGSVDITGSFGLYSFGSNEPSYTPDRQGLFYFTDNDLYISLD